MEIHNNDLLQFYTSDLSHLGSTINNIPGEGNCDSPIRSAVAIHSDPLFGAIPKEEFICGEILLFLV